MTQEIVLDGTEKIWKDFNQIETDATNLMIHGGSFIFTVPPQNYDVIEAIQKTGHRLKLALYRSLDGTYSETAFNFDYLPHYDYNICYNLQYKISELP